MQITNLFEFFLRHRRMVFVFSLLIAGLCLAQLPQLKERVAVQDFLDPDMVSTKDLEHMQENFGAGEVLVANLNREDWTSQDLCVIEVAVENLLTHNPEVEDFTTPLQMRRAHDDGSVLSFPRLIPDTCQNKFDNPLKLLAASPWAHTLTNPQGTDYSLFIQLRPLKHLGHYGKFDPQRVHQLMSDLKNLDPNFTWSGGLAHEYFNYEGSEQSMPLNALATIILFVGLRVFFGTWLAGGLFFLTLCFTNIIILAGMSLAGHAMGPLEACLFLLIMISTLEDFVFVSASMLKEPDKDWQEHMKSFLMPGLVTSITTAVGFASLMVSDVQMIRRFGFWSSIAGMLEWVVVFLVFPCVFIYIEKYFKIKSWVQPKRVWIRKFARLSQTSFLPKKLVYLSFVVLIVYPLVTRFNMTQTPTEMFPPDHPFQKSLATQKEKKGWIASAYLVFNNRIGDEKKNQIIETLKKDPYIYDITSLDSIFQFMVSDIQDVSIKRLVRTEYEESSNAEKLKKFSTERAVVYLKSTETKELNRVREMVSSLCPKAECQLVGEYIGFAELSQVMIKTLFESLFMSLALVSLIIFYLVRKFRVKEWLGLYASLFWGPLFVLTSIQICGFSVNFVTCIVASILVGLAGDNAVQYLYAGGGLSIEGIDKRSDASLICSTLMSALALVFIFSYFQPPRSLGILLSIGFLGNLVGDLWVLKALIRKRAEN